MRSTGRIKLIEKPGHHGSKKKDELAIDALQALRTATDIPIEIGKRCAALANHAIMAFDYGFASARGDSHVALDSAIAGLAGCISIVYLNLKSLSADDWTENVQSEAAKLKAMYIAYLKDAALRLDKLEVEATKGTSTFVSEADTFRSGYLVDARREDAEIERIVNRLQNSLWSYRTKVWMDNAPEDPIDILHPEIVLEELLGYEFRQVK